MSLNLCLSKCMAWVFHVGSYQLCHWMHCTSASIAITAPELPACHVHLIPQIGQMGNVNCFPYGNLVATRVANYLCWKICWFPIASIWELCGWLEKGTMYSIETTENLLILGSKFHGPIVPQPWLFWWNLWWWLKRWCLFLLNIAAWELGINILWWPASAVAIP